MFALFSRVLLLPLLSLPNSFVKKLNKTYANNWDDSGIEVVIGIASFVDARTVAVESPSDDAKGSKSAEKREFTANNILVACGGEPDMPEIPGMEHCITSDGFFDLEQQVTMRSDRFFIS